MEIRNCYGEVTGRNTRNIVTLKSRVQEELGAWQILQAEISRLRSYKGEKNWKITYGFPMDELEIWSRRDIKLR